MECNPQNLADAMNRNQGSDPQTNQPVNEDLKAEEEKLKAKYQLPSNWRGSGHSAFLQKKLAKGQKYFDSGDYQMAKQNTCKPKIDKAVPQPLLKFATGEAIPTPDSVPVRKTSIIQPKFTPAT